MSAALSANERQNKRSLSAPCVLILYHLWFAWQKSIARRASCSNRLPSAANRRHLLRSLSASVLARRSSSSSSLRTLSASSRARDSAVRRSVREAERRACSACCFSRAVVSADISRRAFSNSSWFCPWWYPNKYAEKTTRTAAIALTIARQE